MLCHHFAVLPLGMNFLLSCYTVHGHKLPFSLCVLCEIVVYVVVQFYHEGLKGNTKDTKKNSRSLPLLNKKEGSNDRTNY